MADFEASSTFVNGQRLTAEEERRMDAAVAKIIGEIRGERPERSPTAPVDTQTIQEYRAEVVAGRDRGHEEKWRRVMDHHGFVLMSPGDLDRHPQHGPQKYIPAMLAGTPNSHLYWTKPNTEWMWRRFGAHPEAFTTNDVVLLFDDSPEKFDTWMRNHDLRRRAVAAGLHLPR